MSKYALQVTIVADRPGDAFMEEMAKMESVADEMDEPIGNNAEPSEKDVILRWLMCEPLPALDDICWVT